MLNLVKKFTPHTITGGDDEGVVAIEYVLVAAFVATGVALVFSTTNLWQDLLDKLNTITD